MATERIKGIVERSHSFKNSKIFNDIFTGWSLSSESLTTDSRAPITSSFFLASQFGIIFVLAEGAACAVVPVFHEDLKQDWCYCQQVVWS